MMTIENLNQFIKELLADNQIQWSKFHSYIKVGEFTQQQLTELKQTIEKVRQENPENPAGLTLEACLYHYGLNVEKNIAKAIELYELAIEQGHAVAMYNRATMHYHGQGGDVNYGEAIKLYDQAIEQGDADAMYHRAYMHRHGQGGDVNYDEAIKLYERAIEQGHASAMTNRAYMHYHGRGGDVNYDEAIKLFEQAIVLGHADAMYNRATMHQDGEGGDVNYDEAIKLYDQAIVLGNASAMYNRATMHYNGEGGGVNYDEAIKLFEQAIVLGLADAMYNRATMHQDGEGGNVNYDKAIKLFEQAIVLGDADSMDSRATMHRRGEGGDVNYDEAIKLYDQAIVLGNADAMYNRAWMHFTRKGDPIDNPKAALLFIQSYQKKKFKKSLDGLRWIANNSKEKIPALTYLFIIYAIGLHTQLDTQKANSYLSKNPSAVLRYLYQVLLEKTLTLSANHTHVLLKHAILYSTFAFSIETLSPEDKETLFAAIIQSSKTNIENGIGEWESDLAVLKKLASVEVFSAQYSLKAYQTKRAQQLWQLLNRKQGDYNSHLSELKALAKENNSTARHHLKQYYEDIMTRLLKQALNQDKKAYKNLVNLATKHKRNEGYIGMGLYHKALFEETRSAASLLKTWRNSADGKRAYEDFLTAAAGGHELGLYYVGLCYQEGIGVNQDKLKALDYYYQAAKSSCSEALQALKQLSYEEDNRLAIIALIYQAIRAPLVGKANDFYDNHYLEDAFNKDGNHFAREALRLSNDNDVPPEGRIALLQILLRKNNNSPTAVDDWIMVEDSITEQVNAKLLHLFAEQARSLGSLITKESNDILRLPPGLEVMEADVFVNCAYAFNEDFNNPLDLRIFMLVAAQQKAQGAQFSAEVINQKLAKMPSETVTRLEKLLPLLPSAPESETDDKLEQLSPQPSAPQLDHNETSQLKLKPLYAEIDIPQTTLSEISKTYIRQFIQKEIVDLKEDKSLNQIAAALDTLINPVNELDFNAFGAHEENKQLLSAEIKFAVINPKQLHGKINSQTAAQALAYFKDSLREEIEKLNEEPVISEQVIVIEDSKDMVEQADDVTDKIAENHAQDENVENKTPAEMNQPTVAELIAIVGALPAPPRNISYPPQDSMEPKLRAERIVADNAM